MHDYLKKKVKIYGYAAYFQPVFFLNLNHVYICRTLSRDGTPNRIVALRCDGWTLKCVFDNAEVR